jgi:hypothetical protein
MTTDPIASDLGSAPGRDGDRLLRRSLNLDAVASGGLGLLLAAAGSLLDEPLGIPASVLVPVGVFLVAYAAALWFVGSRPRVSRPAVLVVVVGNLLWVVASVVAAIAGWWSPTAVGTAFVLAQAAAVALFAELQFTGLRRARVEMA